MSITEWENGALVVLPDEAKYIEYARKQFAEAEYFGAFARVHALIEVWMENLYELDFSKTHDSIQSYDRARQGYRYLGLAKDLLKIGALSVEEMKRIQAFGELRNNILHRMLKYSFKTYPWNIVKKEEAIAKFEDGLALCELLRAKCQGHWPMFVVNIPVNPPNASLKGASEFVFGNNAKASHPSTVNRENSEDE